MHANAISLKGVHSFYKILNPEDNVSERTASESNTRGRSKELIENRNKCLFYRFYFYSKIHNYNYVNTISVLSKEFFLSTRTVSNIFLNGFEYAQQVFKEKKTAKELEEMFRYLNWRI